jgi:hypothetical protein
MREVGRKGNLDGNNGNEDLDEDRDGDGNGDGQSEWEQEQEREGDRNKLLTIFKLFLPVLFTKIFYVPCKRHGDVYVAMEKSSLEMLNEKT